MEETDDAEKSNKPEDKRLPAGTMNSMVGYLVEQNINEECVVVDMPLLVQFLLAYRQWMKAKDLFNTLLERYNPAFLTPFPQYRSLQVPLPDDLHSPEADNERPATGEAMRTAHEAEDRDIPGGMDKGVL